MAVDLKILLYPGCDFMLRQCMIDLEMTRDCRTHYEAREDEVFITASLIPT